MPANSEREHPAARAAREINDRLPASVLNQGIVEEVGASEAALQYKCELVAIIRRAYAERDARVLKALEACAKVMQATITRDAYLDAGFEFPGYGGQTFFEIAKQADAAIAEMKGE